MIIIAKFLSMFWLWKRYNTELCVKDDDRNYDFCCFRMKYVWTVIVVQGWLLVTVMNIDKRNLFWYLIQINEVLLFENVVSSRPILKSRVKTNKRYKLMLPKLSLVRNLPPDKHFSHLDDEWSMKSARPF